MYVGGYTFGTLPGQTSAGARDVIVRKYDANGNELWTRQFGTARNDGNTLTGMPTDGRSVYVGSLVGGALPGQTHAKDQDAYVIKFERGES